MAVAKKKVITKKPVTKPVATKKTAPVRRGRPTAKKNEPVNADMKADGAKQETVVDHDAVLVSQVEGIEYLNMIELSKIDRLLILDWFANHGYIRHDLQPLLSNLEDAVSKDYLRLNHVNKLIYPTNKEAHNNSYAASHAALSVHVTMGFSKPGPVHPEMITKDEALYLRVN